MSEYQNNYWYCKVYLHYAADVDKVKMDYSLYQLVDNGEEFHLESANSEERFDLRTFKTSKIGFVKKTKLKDGIHFGFIFQIELSDFSEAEKTILLIVKNYVSKRLFFKPRFKKFFLIRINFLIEGE